ncbi:MAG: amidohydrolase family protein [Candidatus Jordarchaeales archaeon]
MLVLEGEDGRKVKVFVVDFHTHVGKEKVLDAVGEAFRSNTPKQTIDFYHRLQFELKACMNSSPSSYRYKLVEPLTEPPKALKSFYDSFGGMWGWTVDQFVAFPFNDYRAYSTKPGFMIPNDMVLKRSLTLPFSPRMLGFVRVDPHDGEGAVREVERCAAAGARGLKLHPISQGFLDEVNSKEVQDVVIAAINNGMPVIFDCRYYATAEDIYELVQSIRGAVKRERFAVVLAHSSMEYTKKGLYDILGDPNIYGDTSGVRGDDVQVFLKMLRNNLGDEWSRKILFGTDFNYFTIPQAVDFLSYLFTWDFYDELDAKLKDVERILAGNALSMIKPHIESHGHTWAMKFRGEAGEAFSRNLLHRAGYAASKKTVETLTYDPVVQGSGVVDAESFVLSLRRAGGGGSSLIVRRGAKKTLVALLSVCDVDASLRVRKTSGDYTKVIRGVVWGSVEVDNVGEAEELADKLIRGF